MKRSVIVVGGGNLGHALACGIEADPPPFVEELVIVEQNAARRTFLSRTLSADIRESLPEIAPEAILLVAVKPGDVASLAAGIAETLPEQHLIISCAAGVPLSFFQSVLGPRARVIRCMPNLAATCRRAITAYVAGGGVFADDIGVVEELFLRVGAVVRLKDEELLHAVTAISGSGPGYLAWLAEVMERAAIELGLPADTSRLLVQHTFDGVAQLLLSEQASPRTVYESVSSPQGTTVAATQELSERHVDEALRAAIRRAAERSQELARPLLR